MRIEVGKSYRGKNLYPLYTVNSITKDRFVEYTVRQASGSKKGRMSLSAFKGITNLKKVT